MGFGIAGAFHLFSKQEAAPVIASAGTELKPELDAALQRTRKLEAEKAALTAEVLNLKSAKPAAPVESKPAEMAPFLTMLGGGSDTNAQKTAMAKMIRAGIQQQVDMKLSALKLRLKLSPEQEEKLRTLLERQYGFGADLAAKMFEGKLSKEEMKEMAANPVDLDTELKSALTPDQYAEYEKYQVEEKRNQAEMMANMELGQIQSMLQLTEAQKDKVFNILYQQAEKQTGWGEPGQAPPQDWQQVMEKQETDKVNALRDVLTPEQLQIYEKQLAAQREMIKSFMPAGDGTDGAVSVGVGVGKVAP